MVTAVPGSNYRGRRLGVAIREGSVREARAEARLSLAQVAGGLVTRTAIHHIENGRAQPSMETLQLIARQTRKPIDFFLLDPASRAQLKGEMGTLHELESLSSKRDFESVISLGLPLLERKLGIHDLAYLRFYLGQAYCRLVRPSEALLHLPAARRHFEHTGDEWMSVEALDWESAALGLLEDPQAIGLAMEALERCRRLDPKPAQTEARILGHIANLHLVAHSWAPAVRYYEAAVAAAGDVKDLLLEAKMHHGLGLVLCQTLSPAKAQQHFKRALALYSIETDASAIYRVENDMGWLLLQQGQLDSAEAHLLRALAGSDELHIDRRGRGFILNNLGDLSLRKGRHREAREYLVQALEAGQSTGEGIVQASTHELLGMLAERQGDIDAADMEFGIAIAILEQLGMPDRLRDLHMQYAEIMEGREDIRAAAQHWKLAAELGRQSTSGFDIARSRRLEEAQR
jgi:tetratricopeptide (TPR) repeat protein